jgi:lipopolysaccharide transport system ATP-binding protein
MNDIVVRVDGLGKKYRIRHESEASYGTLRDAIADRVRRAFRPPTGTTQAVAAVEDFWALKDVSFQVQRGEVLGIIGRNGAGKSTLLKILSRITEPTEGRLELDGRVASLLEVGTGFHPELTGRENIFLNGAILGMSRAETRRKFDEIVAFAEVDRFLDTPVKHFSSGMYVRLAFAVAAHLEPDILIVDEVLAVGDAQFQRKCIGKMGDVARQGRTVLVVSHNLSVVSALTNRCLILDQGRLAREGETNELVSHYLGSGPASGQVYEAASRPERPYLRRIEVVTSGTGLHESGKTLQTRFEIEMPAAKTNMCLSFQIVNQYQQAVVHAWIYDPERPFCRQRGINVWECELPALSLNVGHYSLRAFLSEPPGGEVFEIVESACDFEVVCTTTAPLFGYRPDACAYLAPFEWRSAT